MPGGRPRGSKNKRTLLKEEELRKIMDRCQFYLACEVEKVLQAVVRKAQDGDMQAAKLILDRVISTRKSVEHTGEVRHVQVTIAGVTIDSKEIEHHETAERRTLPANGSALAKRPGLTYEPAAADPAER